MSTKSTVIRAFVAIALPLLLDEMIDALIKKFPEANIRWTKPSNLHITLQFIQALKLEEINTFIFRIQQEIKNIKPFYLTLGHLEFFPNANHPHIISLEIEPHQTLELLAISIGKVLTSMNYVIDNRPFRAHLTLARLKNARIDASQFQNIPKISCEKIFVQEIILFESKPSEIGSNYIPLARIALD